MPSENSARIDEKSASDPGSTVSPIPGNRRLLRRFQPFLGPVRGMLALGLMASALQAALQWVAPWPLKLIFDSVLNHLALPVWLRFLPSAPDQRLAILAAAMALIAVALGGFSYLSTFWLAQAGQRLVYDVRLALFTHLEAQSLGFHQRRPLGDIMSRLSGDVQALQGLMVNAVPTLVSNLLTLVGILVIMLWVDWRFALITMALAPLLHLSASRLMVGIKTSVRRARGQEGVAASVAQEVLAAIVAVQVFGREAEEAGRFASATGEGLSASRRAIALQSALTTMASAVTALAVVPVVWLGVLAILHGQLTAGELLVFMAYLRATYTPVRQMAKLAIVWSQGTAAAERIAEILDTAEEVPEHPRARPPAASRGELVFEGVSFAFADSLPALSDIDLKVAAGSRLALVGATGSGKSTLVRLIPRFFDPSTGIVRLDGVGLRFLTLAGLRQQVALVTQEPYIFSGTVWENIAYGAVGARLSREAAMAAARAAGVDEVLDGLRDGYDTQVAERGSTLSGGQRQCISVARAMARNPRVLILDEPTQGLDASAEALLLAALERLASGRTTIVVSHQLAAVRNADQIVVLEGGRVVEQGTHDELLKGRAGYWNLHSIQATQLAAKPPVDGILTVAAASR